MELPDFPLAPWEVPPDSDVALVAPADLRSRAQWQGRETECLIRAVNFAGQERLFFREIGSDEVGNWAMSEWNTLEEQALYAAQSYASESIRLMPETAFRLFCFDGAPYHAPGAHILVVGRDNAALQWSGERIGFRWHAPGPTFTALRAAQVGRIARAELENPDSQMRFAFDWLHLTRRERQSLVFGVSPADLKQIERLMRYVLHADSQLAMDAWNGYESSQTLRCQWSINAPESSSQNNRILSSLMVADEIYIENYEPHFHGFDEDDYLENMPARFCKWRSIFYRYFGLAADKKTMEKIYQIEDERAKSIHVVASFPSAHEKLEAHRALHDWFIQSYAPRQFADLIE